MKKYFLLISTLMFLATPNVYADTFTWFGVFSYVAEYDQTDFPGKAGDSTMIAQAFVAEDPPSDAVTLDSTVTGGIVPLPWSATLGAFFSRFDSPPLGSAWQAAYTFHSGTSSEALDLSGCTVRQLSIPQAIIFNGGKTISWAPVAHATFYRLNWYNIDSNTGLPVGGKIADTGNISATSYTMQNPPPSGTTLAVRIMAREHCSSTNKLINVSALYKIDAITDTPIPTLSEWGMIVLAVLLACSAIVVMRRRQMV